MSTTHGLVWERTDYVPSSKEFRDIDALVSRAFGARAMIVRYGDAHGGWTDSRGSIEYALCLDGRTLHRTGISGARPRTAHREGDTLTVPAGRRVFRVSLRDGSVLGYATNPDVEVAAAATLPDGRVLLVIEDEGVVRCRDEGGSLVPERAWRFEGASDLRVFCDGRAALVVGDPPARAALWWLDGDDARELLVRDEFDGFVALDGSLDETGEHFVRPAKPYAWDGGDAWILTGLDALSPSPEALASAPLVESTELPPARAAIPWSPLAPAAAPAPKLPRTAPTPTGSHVKALVAWMRARAERSPPDMALAPLLTSSLPDDLRAVLTAAAWHGMNSLSLGEYWASQPAETDAPRLRGSASVAVRLGTLASGDDVVARLDGRRATVVIVSHEGDADHDRGSLESFLADCVEYARERGESTVLDAYLSG